MDFLKMKDNHKLTSHAEIEKGFDMVAHFFAFDPFMNMPLEIRSKIGYNNSVPLFYCLETIGNNCKTRKLNKIETALFDPNIISSHSTGLILTPFHSIEPNYVKRTLEWA